jgi:hypothetical protein
MAFTVIDVLRALQIEPAPAVSWACGIAVRDAWIARTGEPPPKGLRTKTSGHGSHCFALYEDNDRSFVESVVRATCNDIAATTSAQGRLFE